MIGMRTKFAFFDSPEVIRAITDGRFGRIGVSVLQWSSYESQQLAIPWTLVDGPDNALALAARIAEMPRLTAEGATSISSAIDASLAAFQLSPFSSTRRVIDVSGDGKSNTGPTPGPAMSPLTSATCSTSS